MLDADVKSSINRIGYGDSVRKFAVLRIGGDRFSEQVGAMCGSKRHASGIIMISGRHVSSIVRMIYPMSLIFAVWLCGQVAAQPHPSKSPPDHFQVAATTDADIGTLLPKQVDVFGVMVYATKKTSDAKVLHAANLLAQYLDNDEDGKVDNVLVVKAMIKVRAAIAMAPTEREMERMFRKLPDKVLDNRELQGLFGEETRPNGADRGEFDAALEEVLHLITHTGYANAYPDIFGEKRGSTLAKAMDKARGGYFRRVPRRYPPEAWYSYYDKTCDYGCQVTEYIYWGLTSLLGAQQYRGRGEEIHDEWKLNTPEKVKQGDGDLVAILTNAKYRLPRKLPDGKYQPLSKRTIK